ncbi:fibrinogen beta chain-like [Sceloporus undulatus]|uniref:fibrinogen beta chain-like n=1 Tax=Sceloporus undulatus TaxID=8520 RepID=UPI001C4B93AC|nr:fibrinogen beta chain-like [Sceloporus undulatus]
MSEVAILLEEPHDSQPSLYEKLDKLKQQKFNKMNIMMIRLLILLFFGPFCSPAPRLSERDDCLFENSKLQQKLKTLQDLSQLYELQLKDLLGNNYHRQTSKVFSARGPSPQDTRLPTTSGSLLVYDQGRFCLAAHPVLERGKECVALQKLLACPCHYPSPLAIPDGIYNPTTQFEGIGLSTDRYTLLFCRMWADYKEGFGGFQNKGDEYWLGNDKIYDLLLRGENSLKIDLMDWHGERRYAIYEDFQLKNEKNHYRISFGTFSGTAGDALSGGSNFDRQWSASLNGMPFSTPDRDNDRFLTGSCAEESKSGWWFNRCHTANLNGLYYKKGKYTASSDNGVVWSTWRGLWYSLKYTAMKIRLPSFVDRESGDGEAD